MSYLLRYEAKGLQNFILRTNRLMEIKGGSLLIEQLGELLDHTLASMAKAGAKDPTCLNQAAGGANIRFSEQAEAEKFKAHWPMIVDRAIPGLQVLADFVPFGQGIDANEAWASLQEKLRTQRNHRVAELPEAGPAVFRAPRTGLPAQKINKTPHAGDTMERQDRALLRRSKAGENKGKDPVGSKLNKEQKWATDLSKHMAGDYVATIHIDGNDLGKRIKTLLSKAGQGADAGEVIGAFSKALEQVTIHAAKAGYETACVEWRKNLKDNQSDTIFPGRPIVIGGDDFTMIVRADLAIPFVKAYLEAFERLAKEQEETLGGALTACAGIAFTSVSFPFNMAHDLAEQLCSHSKSQLRGKGANGLTASGISFHRVTTSMIKDYDHIRETELSGAVTEKEPGFLTAAPYTLHPLDTFLTIEQLTALSKQLGKLPSGPVRETIRLLGQHHKQALEKWGRLDEVAKDNPKQREALSTAQAGSAWLGQGILELAREGKVKDETKLLKHTALLDAWVCHRMSHLSQRR